MYRAVNALRRVLYLQAALWVLVGVALATVPRFVLVTLFDQPPHQEFVWVRALGVESIGLALVTVLVAHRVEELWWWAWAFAFTTVAATVVVVLNAAFGLARAESRLAWWSFAAVLVVLSLALLYGLYISSREQPLP